MENVEAVKVGIEDITAQMIAHIGAIARLRSTMLDAAGSLTTLTEGTNNTTLLASLADLEFALIPVIDLENAIPDLFGATEALRDHGRRM